MATAAESPTPLPRYHRSSSRASLVARDRYGFEMPSNYRRTATRQSYSRTSGGAEGHASGLRRSLSSTRESPSHAKRDSYGSSRPMSAMATAYAAARDPNIRRSLSKNTSSENNYNYRYTKDDESSDDDVPAPIKFSASVRALLEEDGAADPAELKSSPRSPSRGARSARPSIEPEEQRYKTYDEDDRQYQRQPRRSASSRGDFHRDTAASSSNSRPARQVRIASPRRSSSSMKRTSPSSYADANLRDAAVSSATSPPRIVRVTGRSPISLPYARRSPSHTTSDRSTRTQRTGSDASEATNGRADEEYKEEPDNRDFVTPAPAAHKRTVMVSGSRRSSPADDQENISPSGGARGGNERQYSPQDENQFEEYFRSRLDDHEHEFSAARPASAMRTRTALVGLSSIHGGEESGMASMRVKRVGKLTGSFLNGPARRGVLRRQSEEERQLERERDMVREEDEDEEQDRGNDIRGTPTPSPRDRRQEQLDKAYAERDASPEPRSTTPPPQEQPQHRNVLQEKKDFKVVYDVPAFARRTSSAAAAPLASIRPASYASHDENDPPATFKRKPQAGSLLDKQVKPVSSYEHEDKIRQHEILQEQLEAQDSPRRQPLGAKSNNAPTPLRAAPPPPPPKMSVLETATAPAGGMQNRKKRVQVTVNRKPFTRLDCIGRGGSGRVYRVMAENCKIFALKRVNLADVDPIALQGYKGEISLLKKLENVERVVRLYDFELNQEKQILSVLMEFGESDLHNILAARLNAEDAIFDPSFTRFYWKEMLECVKSVHSLNIVHSDLKPANFVLVRGKLKLIDFGIADAIQENTVNVHRETQIGTPNYMAPEALIDTNAGLNTGKMMKLGKPSDVWSLGCILYQMVYGRQPFAHIQNQLQRIMAISNPNVAINFPERTTIGDVKVPAGLLKVLKGCLTRDQRKRPSVEELLSDSDPFLHPEMAADVDAGSMKLPDGAVPMTQEMLARILNNVVHHCRARGVPKDEDIRGWPAGFMKKIRAAMEAEGKK
ncbi:Dual-specificity kinase, spindle pole body (SPB) duplication and spindle checkpoint function [Ascosphaera pollenicola]|nr:Dual-specificity kinase, spindle pole body (SPB) duplication and spindle checkpoint function [Ascosphaera pollenicola]